MHETHIAALERPAIRQVLLLLALPLCEFILLRFLFREFFEVRIGFPTGMDWDYLVPGTVALASYWYVLFRTNTLGFLFSAKRATVHSAAAFLLLISGFFFAGTELHGFSKLAWYLIALFSFCSSFFVFISPKALYRHKDFWLILPAALLAFSKLIFRFVFDPLWVPAMFAAGRMTHHFLSPLIPGTEHSVFHSLGGPFVHITGKVFTLAIGLGCSGLEGVGFILSAIVFAYIVDKKRFAWHQWFFLSVLGATYFFCLNVLRLALIYVTAVAAINLFGKSTGVDTALWLVHGSFGWLLHLFGLISFFKLAWHRAPKTSKKTFAGAYSVILVCLIFSQSAHASWTSHPSEEPTAIPEKSEPSYGLKFLSPWDVDHHNVDEEVAKPVPTPETPQVQWGFNKKYYNKEFAASPEQQNRMNDGYQFGQGLFDDIDPDIAQRDNRACDDITTGLTLTCAIPGGNWSHVNTANNNIYTDSGCTNQCLCGVASPMGACTGCGYQSANTSGSCYTNALCTNPCVPSPQFPEHGKDLGWALTLLFPTYLLRRKRKPKDVTKPV